MVCKTKRKNDGRRNPKNIIKSRRRPVRAATAAATFSRSNQFSPVQTDTLLLARPAASVDDDNDDSRTLLRLDRVFYFYANGKWFPKRDVPRTTVKYEILLQVRRHRNYYYRRYYYYYYNSCCTVDDHIL